MVPGRQEWDENVLRMCLYPHDVAEVLKIRPMQDGEEDFNAWFYEKLGIFTVKSAYRLAQESEHMTSHDDVSTNSNLSGGRQNVSRNTACESATKGLNICLESGSEVPGYTRE
jgi:hypothetical protein